MEPATELSSPSSAENKISLDETSPPSRIYSGQSLIRQDRIYPYPDVDDDTVPGASRKIELPAEPQPELIATRRNSLSRRRTSDYLDIIDSGTSSKDNSINFDDAAPVSSYIDLENDRVTRTVSDNSVMLHSRSSEEYFSSGGPAIHKLAEGVRRSISESKHQSINNTQTITNEEESWSKQLSQGLMSTNTALHHAFSRIRRGQSIEHQNEESDGDEIDFDGR